DRFGHRGAIDRTRGAKVIAGSARGDDQEIEARFGQGDVVGDNRARSPIDRQRNRRRINRSVFHARPRAGAAAPGTTTGAVPVLQTVSRSRRGCHVRSVSTSEVVSTIAPQTTWKLLIHGSRRLSTVSAPSVTCTTTRTTRRSAGRVISR